MVNGMERTGSALLNALRADCICGFQSSGYQRIDFRHCMGVTPYSVWNQRVNDVALV